MKKVCVISGTRADYGLLKPLMTRILNSSDLSLQICVAGTHLSPEYGYTLDEILSDGFSVDDQVELLLSSDSSVGISKSIGLGIIGFAEAFRRLDPDCVLVLGDRFEILSAAISAMAAGLPIAHLHGGEITESMIDDAIRHSVTKMSNFHFVATETYRHRVIQLGEDPNHVFTVGGMGVDAICDLALMSRAECEAALNMSFLEKNLLITFHPVITSDISPLQQLKQLLHSLSELDNTRLIFTYPNADHSGRALIQEIAHYCTSHETACFFKSLGYRRYRSCLQYVDGVLGNSSSGLLEALHSRLALSILALDKTVDCVLQA